MTSSPRAACSPASAADRARAAAPTATSLEGSELAFYKKKLDVKKDKKH